MYKWIYNKPPGQKKIPLKLPMTWKHVVLHPPNLDLLTVHIFILYARVTESVTCCVT